MTSLYICEYCGFPILKVTPTQNIEVTDLFTKSVNLALLEANLCLLHTVRKLQLSKDIADFCLAVDVSEYMQLFYLGLLV